MQNLYLNLTFEGQFSVKYKQKFDSSHDIFIHYMEMRSQFGFMYASMNFQHKGARIQF